MTLIVLSVVVYVGLYVILSVPSVQQKIKEMICEETSGILGGKIGIESLSVRPFSEVMLTGVTLDSPAGERCASIVKVAAGIDLWTLFSDRRIAINYAEIIGLDVKVVQPAEYSPYNIQFLIDALSPKDKDKPQTLFDLKIRNIVVRGSKASLLRPWMTDGAGAQHMLSDIRLNGLRMDLSIPVLKNDLFKFDVRNIRFDATPGVSVRSLSAYVTFLKDTTDRGGDRLLVHNLNLSLPHSNLSLGDLDLNMNELKDFEVSVKGAVTPSDFASLLPQLEVFDSPWDIGLAGKLMGDDLRVSELRLYNEARASKVILQGELSDFNKKDSLGISLERLDIQLSPSVLSDVSGLIPNLSERGSDILHSLGNVSLELEGDLRSGDIIDAHGVINTAVGALDFEANISHLQSRKPKIVLKADADEIELNRLLATEKVGRVSAHVEAEVTGLDRHTEGSVSVDSEECVLMGNLMNDISLKIIKHNENIDLSLSASSNETAVRIDGEAVLAGDATRIDADMMLSGFNPSAFGMKGKMANCLLSGTLKASTVGNSTDNITGLLEFRDIDVLRSDGSNLTLSRMTVAVDSLDRESSRAHCIMKRDIKVSSDWLDARATGYIAPTVIAREIKGMVGKVFPTLIMEGNGLTVGQTQENEFEFDIKVKGVSAPYTFFNTPFRPLADIPIHGSLDASRGIAGLSIATPHLQQGRNKLIRDVSLDIELDAFLSSAKVKGGLIFPAKKGDAEIAADIYAYNDKVNLNIGLNPTLDSSVKGGVALESSFSRIPDPFDPKGLLAVRLDILPSTVTVNDMAWIVGDGNIDYFGKRISVRNFLISHGHQFIKIDGVASESADDVVDVRLNDIDLDYIFNLLNINYVSFGGMATGAVSGRRLLTKAPEASTEYLRVRGLSYNGAELGDADIASDYDAKAQKVGIFAVIRDPLTRERRVNVDGGIWVTRDSLSFGFDAEKVNVGVMKPFVSAFCSDLYGKASGKCKLYGTFSDIDLVGALKADTISMKLDFTNTWYHAGGDSVYLHKGVIDIPPLTLYDDDKHTAELSGWLKHTYFHNPVFGFRLKDARSLLCYNTNESINPLWYGTIYGSGHAQINGRPGLIDIDMNMATEEGSTFTYVISEAEDVAQYSFLSFTDKRKEGLQAATVDSVPDYLQKFRKQTEASDEGSSNVILSLKGTVTNDALVTLVMDPKAGDNITARGQGALQMDYNLASNDIRMIGTYVLDEGNYNFSLQDIIIKNFNIRKGSLIKFDGDPMKANLDIAATYRVNTNLTDLDKSFSTDKELNRTNVPVDAVLLVDGPMTNPDITFDIELPSLTSDVERKVKSIVSTNDMMNRQIIYLLALNRFYTPEYTGGQSNGSEWSSMASSTISSQLSNILSQMTDKLDVAPSFRSEKGDFSDMEFDLALSSRLLNNRLLINGNFGYRDRSTSNTQFIGDFDIEYLLSKNGNLRLKAYNHFNDQNYYLRSALTTQGVGVVFRRDFDRLLGRKKDEDKNEDEDKKDHESRKSVGIGDTLDGEPGEAVMDSIRGEKENLTFKER